MASKVKVFAFFVLLMAAAGIAFAQEQGDCPEGNCDSTTVENDVNQQQSLHWNYNPVTKDNVSIGSWLHASGMAPGLPDIPLHYKLLIQQYNEATPGEIFASMPDVITREHVAAYRTTLEEEMGSWDRSKLNRNLNRRSFTWVRDLPAKDGLRVFPGYPNAVDPKTKQKVAVKGRDYKMIARLVFNSEDEIVYREDLAINIVEWGLNKGADALIITGWGARRVFDTQTGALSLLTAFGQIFTSGWTGAMNISPGGAYSSGSNQTETLPYLRVAAVQLVDKRRFVLGMVPQKDLENAAKTADEAEGISEEDLSPLREDLAQRKTLIAACPTANDNNANLRYEQGMAYLNLATKTPDDQERQGALVGASDNFGQSLRDGLEGVRAKEVYGHLASIWYAMAQDQPEDKRGPYYDKVRDFASKAGIEEVQVLKFNQ